MFTENRIFSIEDGVLVLRIGLTREADGKCTVVHTEFHELEAASEMSPDEIGTQWADLALDTEKIEHCIFYDTLQEAVDASRLAMAGYSDWMKNAQHL